MKANLILLTIAALVAAFSFLVLAPEIHAYDFDGRKFCVRGKLVQPCHREQPYSDIGIASVYRYGPTASGQKFDPSALTAAHRWLPFGSLARVTNLRNKRTVVVTINDRGPFVHGRIIDLTPMAAKMIGFSWLAKVRVETMK